MSDLIPIFTRPIGDSINAVDARELHRSLGVVTRFNDWWPRRVEELPLLEGDDFVKMNDSAYSDLSSANRIDYAVTIDAAKHLAMAEKTAKGREVRAYFIASEKRLRAPVRAIDWRAKREERLAAQAESAARKLKIHAYERYLVLGGDHVTDAMRQVVGAKMVEIATGEPATMLLPADVRADWKTPTQIAEDLDTNSNVIGRIVGELGLKGPNWTGLDGMSEPITNQAKHADRQVTSYRYSPEAAAMIRDAYIVRITRTAHGGRA